MEGLATTKKTEEGKPQGEHQVPKPPPMVRSISNKERGGSPERKPSLEEPPPGRWVNSLGVLVVQGAKMSLISWYPQNNGPQGR
jgi:hypothetical protein